MKEATNTGKIYAGSGSRSLKLDTEMFNKVFTRLVEMIRQTKPSMLITGMAEGFDEALALKASNIQFIDLRNQLEGKMSFQAGEKFNEK